MKKFLSNLWAFIRQPLPAVLGGALVVAAIILIFFTGGSEFENYDIEAVQRQTVTQEVNVTGRVEPAEELELSVERGGRIVSAPYNVGDRVSRGTLLVSVSSGTLSSQRQDAVAALEREEIKLAQLKNSSGSSGVALQNARTSMDIELQNSFATIDTSLALYIDQLFENARSGPSFGARFTTSDGTVLVVEGTTADASTFNALRRDVNTKMNDWQGTLSPLNTDTQRFSSASDAYATFDSASELANALSLYLNRRTAEDTSERAIIDDLKSDIAQFRGLVTTSRTSISTAEQAVRSAQTSVSSDEVRFQELAVAQARARLSGIDAQLAEGAIRAPIAGTITRQEASVGEYLSPATPVVTLASGAAFEIESFVPEADISKISVGDRAELTLDAFDSDEIFNAEVVFIDPAETVSEGIATFKVTLHFVSGENTKGVLPGMTADIDIFTGRAEDVIAVPQRALTERDGSSYVRIVRGQQIYEVEVTTGLKGTDGLTEILDGLSEGDQIIVFERE